GVRRVQDESIAGKSELLAAALGHRGARFAREAEDIGRDQDGGFAGVILKRQCLYIKVAEDTLVRMIALFIAGEPNRLGGCDDVCRDPGAPVRGTEAYDGCQRKKKKGLHETNVYSIQPDAISTYS